MKEIFCIPLIALVIFISPVCYSENEVEKLSPELRVLFRQEMLAIQDGMQKIVPAFASGNLQEVSGIAGSINRSFILNQKITKSQKHELHENLPQEFMLKDQQFHKYAGMLERVGKEGHIELVGFYYAKLLESCVGCHSEHATHRFPIFTKNKVKDAHHH